MMEERLVIKPSFRMFFVLFFSVFVRASFIFICVMLLVWLFNYLSGLSAFRNVLPFSLVSKSDVTFLIGLVGKCFVAIVLLSVVISFVVTLIKHLTETTTIDYNGIEFKKTFFGSYSCFVPIYSITAVDVFQSYLERSLNIGTIYIGSNATSGWEIGIKSICRPEKVREIILKLSRLALSLQNEPEV